MAAIATAVLVTITEDGEVEHWGLPVAVAEAVVAAERGRRAGEEPVITRRLDVTERDGGPLEISDEAIAALADAGVVPVRQADLERVLEHVTGGAFSAEAREALDRVRQAAAWQGMSGPVPFREELVTVSREDLRLVLRNGRYSSTDLIAAADRLAFAARYTAEERAQSPEGHGRGAVEATPWEALEATEGLMP